MIPLCYDHNNVLWTFHTVIMRAALIALLISQARNVQADVPTVDIKAAMVKAAKQHPLARERQADVREADARADVERARYLPDLELFAQVDRTTTNTSNGVLFPEPGIPVLSGSPGRTFDAGTWGSAAGVTASWDVLGYRRWNAQISAADRAEVVARDDADLTKLDVSFHAGDRFILVVEHVEAVKAARAGVERAKVFVDVVQAAVQQNLRPGADLSRAKAELSLAETALIHEESAAQVSLANFEEAYGSKWAVPIPVAGKLLTTVPTLDINLQPLFNIRRRAAEREVDAAKARKDVVATGTQPRLALVGSLWARGGNDPGGIGADGLVPDVPNWTAAIVFTWPLLANKLVSPQLRAEEARVVHAQSQLDEVNLSNVVRSERASSVMDAAFRIAKKTPVTLAAARDAEAQAVARYQAKLATADDVAQSQRLLQQAEIDDSVARLEAWRGLLGYAYAAGDLSLFTIPYDKAVP